MRKFILLEAVAVFLAILVVAELGRYFRDPVPPDEKHLPPTSKRWVNHEMELRAESCRREGKLLLAVQQDFEPWTYECRD